VDGMILGDPEGLSSAQTLMTKDGIVLGLRDDLSTPLIKVLRRCGGGIDVKHYCIGKVWQGKANKESYEAEFNVARGERGERESSVGGGGALAAECLSVFGNIFEQISKGVNCDGFFFRLGETSIGDGIMDMCGLGVQGHPKGMLKVLTEATAFGPGDFLGGGGRGGGLGTGVGGTAGGGTGGGGTGGGGTGGGGGGGREMKGRQSSLPMTTTIEEKLDAIEDLSKEVKERLLIFLDASICPLPSDPTAALSKLGECAKKLKLFCVSKIDPKDSVAQRKVSRQFEIVARGISDLLQVVKLMPAFGLVPAGAAASGDAWRKGGGGQGGIGGFIYCCVDMGLRVKKCSGTVFSCVGLQSNVSGVKLGEGGR